MVDLTSSCYYSFLFMLIRRLVVPGQGEDSRPVLPRENSSRVTNVGHIAHVSNDKSHYSAAATPVSDKRRALFLRHKSVISISLVLGLSRIISWHVYRLLCPFPLCLREPPLECLSRVPREALLLYNHFMEVVPQEVSAGCSTMAVINSEETAPRPR
jgi:hypothetical protein